jgi:hypothetical protein
MITSSGPPVRGLPQQLEHGVCRQQARGGRTVGQPEHHRQALTVRQLESGEGRAHRMQQQAQRRKGNLCLVLDADGGQHLTAAPGADPGRHVQQCALADSRVSEDQQRRAVAR